MARRSDTLQSVQLLALAELLHNDKMVAGNKHPLSVV